MSNATNGNGSKAVNTDAKTILEASADEAKRLKAEEKKLKQQQALEAKRLKDKEKKAANTTKAVGVKIEELEGKRDRVKYTEQIALKNPTALAEIVGNYYDDEEHDIRYWEGVVTVYLVRDGKETAIEVGTLTKQGFEMIIRDVKLLAIVDQIKKKWGYVEQVSKATKKVAKRKQETSEGESALMALFNAKRG